MKPKKRQKLCHNCEGEADIDVIVCPFCAADLTEERTETRRASPEQVAPNHFSDALYPSPRTEQEPEEERHHDKESAPEKSLWRDVGVIAFFAVGVQLCWFGLFLAIFSHGGTLVLKWSSRFWFLYLFASIPMLLFGYRALGKVFSFHK